MTSENIENPPHMSPGSAETFYGSAIMLFVLAGLLCGILFRELNKKYGLPYTPLLMLLGVILGNVHPYIGEWGRAVFTMEAIHPHTGMSVFVPTLVFTGGNYSLKHSFGSQYFYVQKVLRKHSLVEYSWSDIGLIVNGFFF